MLRDLYYRSGHYRVLLIFITWSALTLDLEYDWSLACQRPVIFNPVYNVYTYRFSKNNAGNIKRCRPYHLLHGSAKQSGKGVLVLDRKRQSLPPLHSKTPS